MFAVLAVGTVWLRLSIVHTTYEINQTNQMIRNAQQQLEKLEFDIAQLRTPQRLEELAKRKLNLSAPDPSQVIVIQAHPQ